ncbi:MDR family MFS transporter [Intestinibacter sp.]
MEIQLNHKKRNIIFGNVLIACIVSGMLSTALTTILLPVMDSFNVDASMGQWLTSSYSLVMGIMMPLTAYLINSVSTKRLYLISVELFIVGVILCILAPNFEIMLLGRVIQACSSGILTAMTQVIALTIFPAKKRGTAMGWYGLAVGVAPVIAPTLSGVISDQVGWRMVFVIVLVIAIITLIAAILTFEDVLETKKQKLDVGSFIASIFAFGGITLMVSSLASGDWKNINFIIISVAGILGMILFLYRQLHIEEPFLELRVVKNKSYLLSLIGSILLYFIVFGSSVMLPLYVQSIKGYPATISGFVTLPGAIVMAVLSPIAGKIYDKIGIRKLYIVSALLLFIANLGMSRITMDTSIWWACILNVFRYASIGCILTPIVTWGVSNIDSSLTSHGTALINTLRTIAGAIGSVVFVGIMTSVAANSSHINPGEAQLQGMSVSFIGMAIASAIFLIIGIWGVKDIKDENDFMQDDEIEIVV